MVWNATIRASLLPYRTFKLVPDMRFGAEVAAKSRWNFFQFVGKFPVSSNFEGNGTFIGICTRFGCSTASCTCTDVPLPSVILSNLKLVRFLQQRFPFENTRRFQSPLSSAIRCEEGFEWLAPNTAEIGDYLL